MNITILLIDDEPRILETFTRVLKLAGYGVLTAENGEKGLALYHEEEPDIILLDLRMPGIDGLEVLQTIRAHDPEANVIVATGHGDKNAVIEALRAGASDFLSKPIDQVSLESALRRAVERIHLKRELRASQEALRQQNEQLEETVKARTAELEREIEERKQTEEALRKSQALLNATGRMARVGGWEFDVGASEVRWSAQTHRIHQVPMDYQPSVDEALSFFPPGEREKLTDAFEAAVETGTPYDLELRFVTAQGKELWVRTICQPHVVDGKTRKLNGTFQDITQRKQMEGELRESLEKYRVLFDAFPLGITIADRDGKITEANKISERLLGISPKEHTQRDIDSEEWHIIRPDGSPMPAEEYASVRALQENRLVSNVEMGIVKSNGDINWINVTAAPLMDDRVVIAYNDITERKQMEKALRESEERYRVVSELVSDYAYAFKVKPDGTLLGEWVTEAFQRITGYAPDELPSGESWTRIFHPQDLPAINAHMAELLEGRSSELDYRIITKGGDIRWLRTCDRPEWDREEKRVTRIYGAVKDITERKKAEKALRDSYDKLALLFDILPVGVSVLDEERRILAQNHALRQILSISQERLLEGDYRDRTYLRADGSLMPVEEFPSTRVLNGESEVLHTEIGVVAEEGKLIWTDVSAVKCSLADWRVVIVTTDITGRKEAEEALRASEERHRTVSELTSDFAYAVRIAPDGTYEREWGTKSIDFLTGYPSDELRERGGWRTLIHPDDVPIAQQHFQNLIAGKLDSAEFRIITADGRTKWLSNHAHPIWDETEGRVARIIGASRDITRYKELEVQIQTYTERLEKKVEETGLNS